MLYTNNTLHVHIFYTPSQKQQDLLVQPIYVILKLIEIGQNLRVNMEGCCKASHQ